MIVTPGTLARISGRPVTANMVSVILALALRGPTNGLDQPFVLGHFLGQLAEESGAYRYDHEIWGPTDTQLRYEGRADLGNIKPGDGFKFHGRGPIQCTGRANYHAFTTWARKLPLAIESPDFEAMPNALLTDPWEGLSAIWFWETHDLTAPAQDGDIATITRRINGGRTHLDQRVAYTGTACAILAGYDSLKAFQTMKGLMPDGAYGPITQRVMRSALLGAKVTFRTTI